MEIGIDSFAAAALDEETGKILDPQRSLGELLERIELADRYDVDVIGLGEHYRKEYLDSAPHVILGAVAARTKKIRLVSAVTVLSAADPVRVFQNYATLDLISGGRAEIVAGRGSFSESFPLFGFDFAQYDALFEEKLDLLLKLRETDIISWKGQFRPALEKQPIYPRPLQNPLPLWIGVGGTPASFARAGSLGLPLMVAIIGGETHRFKPLLDLYRKAAASAGHALEKLRIGVHSPGYIATDNNKAEEEFFPGYADVFTKIGRERGWPPVRREQFDHLVSPQGSFLIGDPQRVAEKIVAHSKALGGISRFTFQMDVANLTHDQLSGSIELLGKKVKPLVLEMLSKT